MTTKTWTVASNDCETKLKSIPHGHMFTFLKQPERLCMVTSRKDGLYQFLELSSGMLLNFSSLTADIANGDVPFDPIVNPVRSFKAKIVLA
jgi:hypothetical protein